MDGGRQEKQKGPQGEGLHMQSPLRPSLGVRRHLALWPLVQELPCLGRREFLHLPESRYLSPRYS